MQVASSQMAGNQVRVVQLPRRLKKGKASATEKAINGELLRGPLARKAWWLKVQRRQGALEKEERNAQC